MGITLSKASLVDDECIYKSPFGELHYSVQSRSLGELHHCLPSKSPFGELHLCLPCKSPFGELHLFLSSKSPFGELHNCGSLNTRLES